MRTPLERTVAAIAVALCISVTAVMGQDLDAVLVKDVNSRPAGRGTDPQWLTPMGSQLFFTAYTETGYELWTTDGTTEGSALFKDIAPINSSDPTHLTVVGDTLFFAAYESTHRELWKSDGTAEGTVRVKEVNPGTALTAVGDLLFFIGKDDTHGFELWRSDGSESGTFMVVDLNPGPGHSQTRDFVDIDGTLYFSLRVGGAGSHYDLWKSDGTTMGTVPVAEFGATSNSNLQDLVNVGGVLYFVAVIDNDRELWKHDPTTGETVSLDVNPAGPSFPNELTNVGGTLFFRAYVDFDEELWKLDGEIPVQVKDINPAASSIPTRFTASTVGETSTLFFFADDGVHGHELWKSDGTEAGTVLVADLNPAGDAIHLGGFFSFIPDAVAVNGTLFFRAGLITDRQLWMSDGTAAGTIEVELNPGSESFPHWFVDFDGTAFFVAQQLIGEFTGEDLVLGYDVWKSDGTLNGTSKIDIAPHRTAPSFADLKAVVGSTLYFVANDKEVVATDEDDLPTDYELWKSDGSAAGTVMVKDINPDGSAFLRSAEFSEELDGVIFFTANDGVTGRELWKTDGTEAGTVQVRDIDTLDEGPVEHLRGSHPMDYTVVGDELFFVADDGVTGRELWKSDGSEAGTAMVADIDAGPVGSAPSRLTNVDGTLFFKADDGVAGAELWKTDGTAAGTVMVKDITPGLSDSFLWDFTALGDTLFFRSGNSLWKSDGTEAGTVHFAGISSVFGLAALDGVIYFNAAEGATGNELWRYEPATDQVELVADINPDGDSLPRDFKGFAGGLFFTAVGGPEGRALWRHDPLTGVTELIADPNPVGDPLIQELVEVAGTLYFSAYGGVPLPKRGRTDLWKSDGTAEGTAPMDFGLPMSISPSFLTDVDGTLFFRGFRFDVGGELFKLGGGNPSIAITSPADDAVIPMSEVSVEGIATDDGAVVSVVVNGVESELVSTENPNDPAEVLFLALIPLTSGVNEIIAVAIDDDGNAGEVGIVVESEGGSLPDCSTATPSLGELWPPNHKMVSVEIFGVLDESGGDDIDLEITGVTSDEPADGPGKHHDPDAILVGDGTVLLRAERLGGGNGRVYEIHFTASNESGSCSGTVQVSVPHDQSGDTAVDDGQIYDATEES